MIINGLPVAIPPPVEFHFSNPPNSTNKMKPEPRNAGAPGSSAPHPTTDPDHSGKS